MIPPILDSKVVRQLARNMGEPLRWTSDKPDGNGWYWMYGLGYGGIEIVHIEIRHNEIWADGVKVDDGWMWAGPIPLPEGELPPPQKKS